ncbi:unnamed protein product, partial [Chrysoparadoxa australica]
QEAPNEAVDGQEEEWGVLALLELVIADSVVNAGVIYDERGGSCYPVVLRLLQAAAFVQPVGAASNDEDDVDTSVTNGDVRAELQLFVLRELDDVCRTILKVEGTAPSRWSLDSLGAVVAAVAEAAAEGYLPGTECLLSALQIAVGILYDVNCDAAREVMGREGLTNLRCEVMTGCDIIAVTTARHAAANGLVGKSSTDSEPHPLVPVLEHILDNLMVLIATLGGNSPTARGSYKKGNESPKRALSSRLTAGLPNIPTQMQLIGGGRQAKQQVNSSGHGAGDDSSGRRRSSHFDISPGFMASVAGLAALEPKAPDSPVASPALSRRASSRTNNGGGTRRLWERDSPGTGGRGQEDGSLTMVDKHLHDGDTLLVTGVMAEIWPVLGSESTALRTVSLRICSAFLTKRRVLMAELLGDLLVGGFDLLLPGGKSDDPSSEAFLGRQIDFSGWVSSVEGSERYKQTGRAICDKSYSVLPHSSAPAGLSLAIRRARGVATDDSSPLPGRSNSLASGNSPSTPSRGATQLLGKDARSIWVDSSIQRADMIAKTYDKVALSHRRWVWSGVDDLAWSALRWKQYLREAKGDFSLWGGGLYCHLKRSRSNPSQPCDILEVKWRLDLTEGPQRIRRRLVQNYRFFENYDVMGPDGRSFGELHTSAIEQRQEEGEEEQEEEENVSEPPPEPVITDLTSLIKDVSKKVGFTLRPESLFDLEELEVLEEAEGDDSEGDEEAEREGVVEEGLEAERSQPTVKDSQERTETLHSEMSGEFSTADTPRLAAGSAGEEEKAMAGYNIGDVGHKAPVSAAVSHLKDDGQWSDNEVIIGLMEPEDWPVQASGNVLRSVGLEMHKGILLVCKGGVYIIDGFEKAEAFPSFPQSKEQDALQGLRRIRPPPQAAAQQLSNTDFAPKIRVLLRRASYKSNDADTAGARAASRSVSPVPARTSERDSEALQGDGGLDQGHVPGDDLQLLQGVAIQRITCDQVAAVYKRRYQLRDVALEIIDVQGRSVLVSFDSQDQQEEVLTMLLTRSLPNSIFVKGKANLHLHAASTIQQMRTAYRRFMQHLRVSTTKRWQSGKSEGALWSHSKNIHLSIHPSSGRSFNDLTQYPVFPWVLSDYTSEEIDLSDPSVYRDLSKPMGALGDARAHQFVERYQAVVESAEESGEEPDPPAFHYGTHYSCAGYILYYLVRLEPFTHLALNLQGGRFDKPDRLFRDIRSSWESAAHENLQDVRELVPEFFYLPEFLVNSNRFDFGTTQKGHPVHHVELPPWAKGDPREFVRIHRQALESHHVSKNLHHWVDLVFGYKQRGIEAVKAQNVFVHLTYEGQVDLDAIEDPMMREATLAQIQEFGQTPARIFLRPHPRREVPTVVRVDSNGMRSVDSSAIAWHKHSTPALCMAGAPENVMLRPMNQSSATGGLPGLFGAAGDVRLEKDKILGVGAGAILYPRATDKYIRFGGPNFGISFHSPSSSVKAGATDKLLSAHMDLHLKPVTCAKCTEDGNTIITGSEDAMVRIWGVYQYRRGGQIMRTLDLRTTLSGHQKEVSCVDVSAPNSLVVSGGMDQRVLVWDLSRFTFVRELPGHHQPITAVSINGHNGNVVTLSGAELRVWTQNGDLLARCTVTTMRRGFPTCLVSTDCPDWQDGVVAVTGHENGEVSLWGIKWQRNKGARAEVPALGEDVLAGLMALRHSPPKQLLLLRAINVAQEMELTHSP